MPRPRLTLIAMVSADGFISTGQGVPWDLPRDKTHFRRTTAGQWLLIGRRTYEEMIGWFSDHHPLVLTRDKSFTPAVGVSVSSVQEALETVGSAGVQEVFVCGGGGAYAAAMPLANRLILTQVEASLGSGVPFPEVPSEVWRIVDHQAFPSDADHLHALSFTTYERQDEAGGNWNLSLS